MPTLEDEAAANRRRLGNIAFLIEAQLMPGAGLGEAGPAPGQAPPCLRELMRLEAALRTRAEALAPAALVPVFLERNQWNDAA